MDSIEKVVKLSNLYDMYKPLLTDKQQTYFEDYYFMNLSLAEIASKYSVSRNAVYSQLNQLTQELEDLESKLHLRSKFETRLEIIEKIKKMNPSDEIQSLIKVLEEDE